MYSIGEIISTYRKKKGLLQQDLADELAKEGITISYKAISNWERNLAEPSVTIFYKVCRILGITNMYEAYFGVNPADPFSSLTDEGRSWKVRLWWCITRTLKHRLRFPKRNRKY